MQLDFSLRRDLYYLVKSEANGAQVSSLFVHIALHDIFKSEIKIL